MSEHPEIDRSHHELVEELRWDVKDLLNEKYDTDFNLERWLKSVNYKKEEAVRNLRRHLKFRQIFDLDNIEEYWKDDELIQKYVPIGLAGPTGINGTFLVIECVGRADPFGMIQSGQNRRFLLSRFKFMEKVLKIMNEQEKETKKMSGAIYIVDLEGLEFDPGLIPIATGPFRIFWDRVGENYPEWIQKFLVINCPTFMSVIWKALSPLLPEITKQKIAFLGDNWKQELLQFCKPENLPKHWGGTMVDESGDEMCRSRITVPAGKIPQSLYWKPGMHGDPPPPELPQLTLPAGGSNTLSYYVMDPATMTIWFQGDQEYTMGVFFSDDPKISDLTQMDEIFPTSEFPGLLSTDFINIKCTKPGAYHIKLGNEKAWIYSVPIRCKVEFSDKKGTKVDVVPLNQN